MEHPITIRAVVFRESEMWVAQCLEYNLASCGDTQKELVENLLGQLNRLSELDPDNPFRDFEPAPQRFFKMYEEASSKKRPEPLQPTLTQRFRDILSRRPARPHVLAAALQ